MGDMVSFDRFADALDFEHMDEAQLRTLLARIKDSIAQLDAQEPEDMNSEQYELWGDRHEELEDLVDEILDILDEL